MTMRNPDMAEEAASETGAGVSTSAGSQSGGGRTTEASPSRETASSRVAPRPMNRMTNYARHTNPLTGAGLLDRGLKETERLVPQVIIEVQQYNFDGQVAIGDAPDLVYGFERVNSILTKEWWLDTINAAIDSGAVLTVEVDGDRRSLNHSNFLEVYCSMYVRTAVNLRNFLAVVNMGDLNEGLASFVLDANIGGSGRARTARNLLDQLARVPIPEFWGRRAVDLAGVYKSGVGEPVTLRFLVAPTYLVTGGDRLEMRYNGTGRSGKDVYDNRHLTQMGTWYNNGQARASWAEAILNDAAWCIEAMNGVHVAVDNPDIGQVPSTWIEDVVEVHHFWHLLNVNPARLPAPLEGPLDSKFNYLSAVNDRPWLWKEERAKLRDNYVFTNLVSDEQETAIREFADAPPREWYAGFGTWAMTHVASSDHTNGKVSSEKGIRLYGEITPFVTQRSDLKGTGIFDNLTPDALASAASLVDAWLALSNKDNTNLGALVTALDALAGISNSARQLGSVAAAETYLETNIALDNVGDPFYIWYNRRAKWRRGARAIDDNILKEIAVGGDSPPSLDPLLNRNVNLVKASRILHEKDTPGKYPVNRPYMMELFEQNLDDLADGWLRVMSEALLSPEN